MVAIIKPIIVAQNRSGHNQAITDTIKPIAQPKIDNTHRMKNTTMVMKMNLPINAISTLQYVITVVKHAANNQYKHRLASPPNPYLIDAKLDNTIIAAGSVLGLVITFHITSLASI